MKIKPIIFSIVISFSLLLALSCKQETEVLPEKPVAEPKAKIEVDTIATTIPDTNRIATDPFRSGDYVFAETAEVFRERFNNYVRKSGWDIHLEKGKIINIEADTICNMPVSEHINIAAKLNKKGEVVKVVLFSGEDFDVPSQMKIVYAMKGMIAAGPDYHYITDDEIEIIMYRLGTLANDKIYPKGIYHRDGTRYEVKVDLSNIYFGVSGV
ncbi:hypothetical protein ACLI09_07250 [Flavobacterium sp. RHBU_24]|uniref:hypothetical protein n=1 Tax=Flavobacterium sp. RHBU_24 TaxID=3391185 RepID=UPI00398513A9